MEINTLKLVALQEIKQIRRNWLFIFFVFIVIAGMSFLQIVLQSSGISHNLRALPCSVPYLNALFYNFLQCLFVIFITGDFIHRDTRKDTIAAIQTRAYENKEYLLGKVIGSVLVFFCLNIFTAFVVAVFQLVTNYTTFDFFPYIFYLFTLTFPTLLFITGLSLFVHSVIRSFFLAIVCLVGYCVFDVCVLTDIYQGVFDMFALRLPNVFSQVTGHVELFPYLVQRLTFAWVGIALVLFAVARMKRIPGNTDAFRHAVLSGCIVLIVGILSGYIYCHYYFQEQKVRQEYVELYGEIQGKYSGLNIIEQHIVYQQEGKRMKVRDSLLVENVGEGLLDEFVLYLNPGLTITGLTCEDRVISHEREGQVCKVKLPMRKGEHVTLVMEYEGKIDERVCYLDIDEKVYHDAFGGNCLMGYGRHKAILEEDFTLLTPECLWYPVSTPPVFPSKSNVTDRMFSEYRLTVVNREGFTAISQGEPLKQENTTIFMNDHALSGVSLCIGKYQTHTIPLDSMSFEMYYFNKQSMLYRECDGALEAVSEGIQNAWDEMVRGQFMKYPFPNMKIVEVPVAFCSYLREWKEGSEFVQPGIIFRPENLCDKIFTTPLQEYITTIKKFDKEQTEEEMIKGVLTATWAMDFGKRTNDMSLPSVIKSLLSKLSVIGDKRNLYSLVPMFTDFTGYMVSDKFPNVNNIFQTMFEDEPFELRMEFYGQEIEKERKAEQLLAHNSLKEILDNCDDMLLLDPVLQVKGRYLKKKLFAMVNPDEFQKFMVDFKQRYKFKHIPFSCFTEEMNMTFGINMEDMMQELYDSDGIPWFYVKDIKQQKFGEGYVLSFDVWNTSESEGVISLYTARREEYMQFREFKNIVVEGKTCKHWNVLLPDRVDGIGISTNMAMNLPNMCFRYFNGEPEEVEKLNEVQLDQTSFLPGKNEIIVDNEDDGFRVVEKKAQKFQRQDAEKYMHSTYITMEDFPVWKASINPEAYGNPYQSFHFKKSGKETSSVEWNANLPETGKYEVFVHHLSLNLRFQFTQETFSYYYTLEQGDFKADIRVDLNVTGDRKVIMTDNTGREDESLFGTEVRNAPMWVSIGEFDFKAGEAKITLSSQGAFPGQLIFADAVKWVKK
ncbi:hypothetical protein [Butyricimonas paravirosa]|uniref:hypothetical protein n=1 Tax=Butyricimonas paravirosa TaxID=1472417 RepID=UPI0022E49104|nr:hypothetical protein [Butyricimonas paravirosa]